MNLDCTWAVWPNGEVHLVYFCHIRQKYRFRSGAEEVYSVDIPHGVKVFPRSYESAIKILNWNPDYTYTRSSDWVYRNGEKYAQTGDINPLLLNHIPVHKWPEVRADIDDLEVGIGADEIFFGAF